MSDDIPFDKRFDLPPGQVEEVAPGIRRLLCNNPGPFTFKGTVSYIVGRGRVAIIDPGPLDDAHAAALLDAVRGETVTHIFVTHTHRDHSPAAARIKAATGAPTLGEGPHRAARPLNIGSDVRPLDSSGDMDFRPDRVLADGDVVDGAGWSLEAITTPGHCANHMAYALKGTDVLFSGDHVMAWSTPVVAPPDGSMSDYMASLDKLVRRNETTYYPGPRRRGARCAALRAAFHRPPPRARGGDPRSAESVARPTFRLWCATSTSGSIRGSPRLPASRCSRISKIWSTRGKVKTDGTPSAAGRYRVA